MQIMWYSYTNIPIFPLPEVESVLNVIKFKELIKIANNKFIRIAMELSRYKLSFCFKLDYCWVRLIRIIVLGCYISFSVSWRFYGFSFQLLNYLSNNS